MCLQECRSWLGKTFILSFIQKEKSYSPIVGALSNILVKKAVLGLLNQVTYENKKYPSL